jgi:hypothetical protein
MRRDNSIRYLTDSPAYPIVTEESQIVPLLREPFTRAVCLRDPEFQLDRADFTIDPKCSSIALPYWRGKFDKTRKFSGKIPHREEVTRDNIIAESNEAGIIIASHAVDEFTDICNRLRGLFTRVFNAYTNTEGVVQRGFTLFTPHGGVGRSRELHIDNTVLTLHYNGPLSTLSLYDGDLSQDVWDALNMLKRKILDMNKPEDKEKLENIILFLIAEAARLPMFENEPNDVMITVGQLGLDLDDEAVRR